MSTSIKKEHRYTYADLESFPEHEIWELIDGTPYLQARPSRAHQHCLTQLIIQFGNFLEDKPCNVYTETAVWLDLKPTDQRKNSSQHVVPDLLIVCDEDKLQDEGIYGVPDLIIEILSPSTAGLDMIKKYNQYLVAGLQEYWIVDPFYQLVKVYLLEEDRYLEKIYESEHKVPVKIFHDQLEIDAKKIFLPSKVEK